MRALVITNIFPNNIEPSSGIFNLRQFACLSKRHEIKVIAPVHWLLGTKIFHSHTGFGKIGKVNKKEVRDGLTIYHPKIYNVPKLFLLAGFIYLLSIVKTTWEIYRHFRFELIIATWAYPDSFAAALLAKMFNVPIIIKVHGSDINGLRNNLVKKMVKYALKNAQAIICVSSDLKDRIAKMGIDVNKIKTVYNGLDLDIFKPSDKNSARKKLKLSNDNKIVLYIGNLKLMKGLEYLIRAFAILNERNLLLNRHLFIVGEGKARIILEEIVRQYKLEKNVTFAGVRNHDEISLWMNASDLVVLPSLSEGMPNVILESLACGKPVVATNIGGIPEILDDPRLGMLVPPKNPLFLAEAIDRSLKAEWEQAALVKRISGYSWDMNAKIFDQEIGKVLK